MYGVTEKIPLYKMPPNDGHVIFGLKIAKPPAKLRAIG